ncbi:MAG: tRNA (pseudouridine(54)-N(1))-methyltransferase TrmY [Candidatus Methanomethylicia archaeon]|nr:tRNA (pseudouridine(54)-N(1))-methyltransferase TrmY [Candidatus Methanomethylicia archaeon]MCX8168867.1 tRNA (pseudouridine(54)-N(1))-methyltransferase TrmY [Candidatus Methanomethylicia archaeon]MDW7988599.1 tRNA (pseudouridine(54)-N(1))-methyltransferase TrmY [Nitrososphaerota archaeon]
MGKRIFLVKSSTAFTEPIFDLKCISSSSGRIDVVCRCILNSFFIDKSIFRRNVIFYSVLEGPPSPPKTICIDGSKVEKFILNEVWIASVIADLMSGKSFSGFNIHKMGFKDIIEKLVKGNVKLIYMHENGILIDEFKFDLNSNYCFIIGDQFGLDLSSEKYLEFIGVPKISLGRVPYLSSQCIWLINNFLDEIGFE